MNLLKSLYFLIISLVIFFINLEAKDERPQLKGPYLGQKPSGQESKNFFDPIDMQTLEKEKIIARRIMIIDCHNHNLFQPGSADKPRQVSFSMLKQSGVKGIVQSFPLDFRAINNPSEDILKNIIDTKNKIKEESLNISVALKSSDFFSPNSDDSFTMKNYSKNEIEKVMGFNFIYFYERVENKAELQKGNVNTQQDDFPVLKGPYLGQKPPGMMPEIFAPGIISTQHKEHSTLAFSPDGTEIYWSIWPVPRSKKVPQTIMFMKIENGKWSEPQAAPFSGIYMDGGPAFFPDGKKLFFYSNRPIKKNGKPKEDSDFWYVNRTKKGWSEPVHAGFLVNSKKFEQALSFSANGNMYFSVGYIVNGKWESSIYRSILKDGRYSKPVNISHLVNTTPCSGLRPYISPDESFIIFSSDCRRFSPKGKYIGGKRRLVITFKKDDNTWFETKEMGSEINISYEGARFPGMSPDGKYLFFTRYDEKWNEDIYWVDAKIIEALKPLNLK